MIGSGVVMLRGFIPRGLIAGCCLAIGLATALMAGSARASDGDGAATPAPRVQLESGDVELVAVAQDRNLLIYLDRFNDGAPISDAQVDVDGAGKTVLAEPVGAGTYLVTADWVAAPGRHEITFTARTKEGSATLAGALEIPSASTGAGNGDATSSASPLTINLPVELVLLIALGILWAFGFGILVIFRVAHTRANQAAARPRLRAVATSDKEPPGRRAA